MHRSESPQSHGKDGIVQFATLPFTVQSYYIFGLAQDYSNSIALAMELL